MWFLIRFQKTARVVSLVTLVIPSNSAFFLRHTFCVNKVLMWFEFAPRALEKSVRACVYSRKCCVISCLGKRRRIWSENLQRALAAGTDAAGGLPCAATRAPGRESGSYQKRTSTATLPPQRGQALCLFSCCEHTAQAPDKTSPSSEALSVSPFPWVLPASIDISTRYHKKPSLLISSSS